jgi:hypothetical protein
MVVYGLAPQGDNVPVSRVRVLVNGTDQTVNAVAPIPGTTASVVTFTLAPNSAGDSPQPLAVMIDSHNSAPFYILIQKGS